MVLAIGQQAAGPALELAEQIRAAGGAVILEGPRRGLGKSLKYADRLGISDVLMLGEDEMAANVVTRRNLTSGEQEKLAVSDLLEELEGK
jgi:histidyl-tRNA synthetase